VTTVVGTLLAVSAAWAFLVPVIPVSDSVGYDRHAWNIAQGYGYGWGPGRLSAFWAPGTAFLYSALYALFGHTYLPIVLLNIALRVGIVVLMMALTREWFGRSASFACGLLLALWPSQVQFTTVLASELPFTFLMLLGLFVWTRESLGWLRRGLIAGLILAAAAYVRPQALLLPVIFAAARVARERQVVQNGAAVIVALVVMVALMAPWSVRNTQLFGQRVLLSTNGGANLWMGNNPQSSGGYMPLPEHLLDVNEAVRDKLLMQQAVEYIRNDPSGFAGRVLRKALVLHERETIGVHWNAAGLEARFGSMALPLLKIVSQAYWLGALFAGLAGLVFFLWRTPFLTAVTHPAFLIWLYFTTCHAVIVIQDRYHFPSIPFIAALAALCFTAVLPRLRSAIARPAALAPACAPVRSAIHNKAAVSLNRPA
jgi:4-amino-4-deoxy-L-arabinose transferase-like glycosyltransferase